jgi:hypothetical protein
MEIQRVPTDLTTKSVFAFVSRLNAAGGRTAVTRFDVAIVTLFKGDRKDTVATGTPTDVWIIFHASITSIAWQDSAVLTSYGSGITFILMKVKVVTAYF